jgi:hypothetical protein
MSAVASEYQFVPLGPSGRGAITRFANSVQAHIKSGAPNPPSPFAKYVAERITNDDDRQDFIAAVSGPRGSGKSYTCLSALSHISEEIANIRGGSPLDYFDPRTNVLALDDAASISELIARKHHNKFQCLLIDDNTALGNHDWNTRASKNAVKIFLTMRTMRNCIFLNAPLFKNLDNSIRDFCQVTFWVEKGFHRGGFNVVRANFHEVSQSGKDYKHRLNFGGNKVDLWASFAPSKTILDYYDIAREESAKRLATLIAETGSSVRERDYSSNKIPTVQKNLQHDIEAHGDTVLKMFKENPKVSMRQIAARTLLSPLNASRVVEHLGLKFIVRKKND